MKNPILFTLFTFLATPALPQTGDYPYTPVKFSDVRIQDAFWSPRIDTNRLVTIPFAFRKSEETGRLRNFKVAGEVNAGVIATGKFCSDYGYDDSDVYKIIEGGAYSLSTHPDPHLEAFLDTLIAGVAAAQESDGYIYTMRTINPSKSWARERWVNDRYNGSHELYNAGHMYEAAVAYLDATGKRTLLDVAVRNAGLLCATFGPGKRAIASGHQEIEIGLTKLYRVTGDMKFLDLARFLLDQRGKGEKKGTTYTQDHLCVTDQEEAVGHAVRATYMYSAMADIAALTGDSAYIRAIGRIWEDIMTGKIYLTGGIGSRSSGEAFGDRYELPNLTAYNETCAAIANVFWNYRMFLLHGDSKYMDVLERTLYNGVISGVSLSGTEFFYPNPLESEGNYSRSEWFGCSCCPSNIARFIPSIPGYIYAVREDTLFVNLYIGNTGTINVRGNRTGIELTTAYPWDGEVTIEFTSDQPLPMTLALRIPGWATNTVLPGGLYRFADVSNTGPSITLNGKLRQTVTHNGYAAITKVWKTGDKVELSIPMPVRKVLASETVTDDRDKVAFTRGPIVFCAEGTDNTGDVKDLVVGLETPFTYDFKSGLLGGVGTLTGKISRLHGDGFSEPVVLRPSSLFLLPYYAWCHRGAGVMNVWFFSDTYIFPPLMDPPGAIFLDSVNVRMKQYAGQEIRYTSGDEYPGQQALPYRGVPVTLHETATLAASSFNGNGKTSGIILGNFTKTGLASPAESGDFPAGLICRYYEGRFRRLPGFDTLKAVRAEIVTDIDAGAIRDTNDAYAMEFQGLIAIPGDGIYTFFIRSDDGGRILINGKEVVVNDGLHEMSEKSGQVALEKGLHRIGIQFFDYGGDEGLEVLIQGPRFNKQRIPAHWLRHR